MFIKLKSKPPQLNLSWTDLTADTRLLSVQSLIHPQSDMLSVTQLLLMRAVPFVHI